MSGVEGLKLRGGCLATVFPSFEASGHLVPDVEQHLGWYWDRALLWVKFGLDVLRSLNRKALNPKPQILPRSKSLSLLRLQT